MDKSFIFLDGLTVNANDVSCIVDNSATDLATILFNCGSSVEVSIDKATYLRKTMESIQDER